MGEVRWDLLNGAPNVADSVMKGFDKGMALRRQQDLGKALGVLQNGPNPDALRAVYAINPQLGMHVEDQLYLRGERQRTATSRNALSDMILGGHPGSSDTPAPTGSIYNALMVPPSSSGSTFGGQAPVSATASTMSQGAMPRSATPQSATGSVANPAQPSAGLDDDAGDTPAAATPAGATPYGSPLPDQRGRQPQQQHGYSDSERQLIQSDPAAFLTYQGNKLKITAGELKNLQSVNNMAMQLLGGVSDQATYDQAKQRAHQLYSQVGIDGGDFISQLPPEYSPETVHGLQLQGMDASKQLAAIARENNVNSEIDNREGRLNEYQRHNKASESNAQRRGGGGGQRQPAPKQPSPTSVVGGIMAKQARGETLTPAEKQTYDEYRAGRGNGGGRRGASAGDGAIIVNPKTGQRMTLQSGRWVPVK